MDVLVVVGPTEVSPRLIARAGHVVRLDPEGTASADASEVRPALIADLRSRIPRQVAVAGRAGDAVPVAVALHAAGLPVTLHTDDSVPERDRPEGVPTFALTDAGPPMEVADSLLDLFGDTPLVRLDRTGRDLQCHLLAKLEMANPGGSVKDRPALQMIEAAERQGLLRSGGTIVEPTSGNTGVGLAIVAARRGYRCVFVVTDKVAQEKIALLRAYGAEVVVCPVAVAPDHPESYYSVAARLTDEIPGAYRPDQYHNPENPRSHELSTGPEIWRQTAGRVTHFVAGIGTGGTITGVARYLKAQNAEIQIVGADPEGSVYSGGDGRPYLVEGIGEDFWPDTYDPSIVDRVVAVSDRDSFLTARRVTREEGLLIGGSGGTAVHAAVQVGRELGPDAVVVVLLPDTGRGYLSKVFDDKWMADYGFLRAGGQAVGDVLDRKHGDLPALVHIHPDETVRDAIALLREYRVSQVPVFKAEPPVAVAEVMGAVEERALLEQAFEEPGILDRPVADVMGPPLPSVGAGEPVDEAVARLEGAPALMVVDEGHPVGILSRSDLLDFLADRPRA